MATTVAAPGQRRQSTRRAARARLLLPVLTTLLRVLPLLVMATNGRVS
ncbi:MAG TPA: hypothetical protein VE968_05555 [Sphingomicrobium sp.]|nr:hypothetical protein [Sphingomicrobium sp.]